MAMTTEEKFKGFTKDNEKYKQAATGKHGETVMNEAEERQKARKKSLQTASTISSHSRIISKRPTSNSYRKRGLSQTT